MEETPIFDLPFPVGGVDPPDGAGQIQGLAERVEDLLAVAEGLFLGAPAAGNIVVVNGTNDPIYKAVTGDVAMSSAGVATIGDGAVTSRKFKPTVGVKVASEEKALAANPVFTQIPLTGGNLEITPAVASNLIVLSHFSMRVHGITKPVELFGHMRVDAEDRAEAYDRSGAADSTLSALMLDVIPLTAAKHTISMRAAYEEGGVFSEGNPAATIDNRFLYALVAA